MTRKQWDELFLKVDTMPLDELKKIIVDSARKADVLQTNADRIRHSTDEKLAETYAGGCPNGDRLNCGKYYLHGGRDCFNCWLDWLKAPVEGAE